MIAEGVGGQRDETLTVHAHAAGVDAVDTGDGVDERGLARPVRSDHADKFAVRDPDRHVPQRDGGAVRHPDVLDLKHAVFRDKR